MPNKVHFNDAIRDLSLKDEEQYLYVTHLKNLYSTGGVDHEDGSRSTLFQAVEQHDGKFYNIPTVWAGKIETEDWTRDDGKVFQVPNQTALDNVSKLGWDKFPSYSTADEADARYDAMHHYMDLDTSDFLQNRPEGD